MEHTPTPWHVGKTAVVSSANVLIADVFDGRPNFDTDMSISQKNARFIVDPDPLPTSALALGLAKLLIPSRDALAQAERED